MALTSLNYDEDLSKNRFLISLKQSPLFEIVADNHLYVCVPRNDTLLAVVLDHVTFQSHILRPDEQNENVFYTLRNEEVVCLNNQLKLRDDLRGDNAENATVQILFEETHINEQEQAYKVLCISHPLTCRKVDADELDAVYGSKTVSNLETFEFYCHVLFGDDKDDHMRSRLELYLRGFGEHLFRNFQLSHSVQYLRDIVTEAFNNTYSTVSRAKLKTSSKQKAHLDERVLRVATEVYFFHHLHWSVLRTLATALREEELNFNRILRQLESLSLIDLGVEAHIFESIMGAKAELCLINDISTPYGKLLRLKKAVQAITFSGQLKEKTMVSSDTLLPVLVYLIVKSGITNWCTNFEYMINFHFTKAGTDELGYILATVEAAMQYIRSDHLKSCLHKKFMSLPLSISTRDTTKDLSPDEQLEPRWSQLLQAIEDNDGSDVENLLTADSASQALKSKDQLDTTATEPNTCHPLCGCDKCRLRGKTGARLTKDSTTYGGRNALHFACMLNRPQVVNVICRLGANIEMKDDRGRTPVHVACEFGSQACVLLLLHAGARSNSLDYRLNSPLHIACYFGRLECAKALIYHSDSSAAKASLNALNEDQETALHIAARLGDGDMVALLLDNGAKFDIMNKHNQSPIDLVGSWHLQQLFQERGATFPGGWEMLNSSDDDFYSAQSHVSDEDIASISPPLRPRADTDRVDNFLKSVADNDLPMVKFYLGEGTEFGVATQRCHPLCQCDNCKRLEQGGALSVDVRGGGGEGYAALHAATAAGLDEMVIYLLDCGADIDLQGGRHLVTALHLAVQNNLPNLVHLLIQRGATVDATDRNGNTALHMAASRGYTTIAAALLKTHADLNRTNCLGNTALHEAAKWDRRAVVEMLLLVGAAKDVQNRVGLLPGQLARSSAVQALFANNLYERASDFNWGLPHR